MMMENAAFDRWFRYESGQHWCEAAYAKYETVSFVAEFANTVSTLPLIVLPLLNAAMLWPYIQEVNSYYHATLNLFGQLVDEVSILWLLDSCVIAFLPTFRCWPHRYRHQINALRYGFILFAACVTILCFVEPSFNAFALMLFTVPAFTLIYIEGYKSGNAVAEKLATHVFKLWTAAMAFWLFDKMMCDIWLRLGTPYLHALFHLFSSLAGYDVFLMFSILDIERRRKRGEHKFSAEVRGLDQWFLGLAYLKITKDADANGLAKVREEEGQRVVPRPTAPAMRIRTLPEAISEATSEIKGRNHGAPLVHTQRCYVN